MKEKTLTIINDKLIIIERYYYESDEMFYFRIKYITDYLLSNKENKKIDEIIGLSKIAQQKKFNHCEYILSTRV
jgi:hypothetical protein